VSSKFKPINRNIPAVLNIITDNSAGLVSSILTRRHPSEAERNLADWTDIVAVAGVTCHIVGRGERVTWARLSDIAEALLNTHVPHEQGKLPAAQLQDIAKANDHVEKDAPLMDFDNDPVWQRIMARAGGAR
jgi:hypothetical protein